jgi:hypothetical protein
LLTEKAAGVGDGAVGALLVHPALRILTPIRATSDKPTAQIVLFLNVMTPLFLKYFK